MYYQIPPFMDFAPFAFVEKRPFNTEQTL